LWYWLLNGELLNEEWDGDVLDWLLCFNLSLRLLSMFFKMFTKSFYGDGYDGDGGDFDFSF